MNPTPAQLDETRVWLEVSDALLAGITHDLNGRVAAIGGLLQVMGPEGPDEEVLRLLQREAQHLDAAVAMLRRYPRGGARPAEAIDPRELLPELLLLHARRDDREGVSTFLEISPDAPPVRAERTWLARALLVLFARAGVPTAQSAGGAPGGAPFGVHARVAAGQAAWSIRPHALPDGAPAGQPAAAADAYLRAAAAFLELAGGSLRVGEEGWEVLLPAISG